MKAALSSFEEPEPERFHFHPRFAAIIWPSLQYQSHNGNGSVPLERQLIW